MFGFLVGCWFCFGGGGGGGYCYWCGVFGRRMEEVLLLVLSNFGIFGGIEW